MRRVARQQEPTAGERWAFWLETQLEDRDWRATDLVKASGVKANGRPVIDAPRVSAWLKGERPSYELASAAGIALGVGATPALLAAGYTAVGDSALEGRARDALDVGEPGHDDDLRYQRPPEIPDGLWREIRDRTRAFIEFEIDRAAKER